MKAGDRETDSAGGDVRRADYGFRSASRVADSTDEGGEHGLHYGDRRDLLSRWARLPAQDATTRPIREVALFGDDAELRENGVIRVADTGFAEQVLFDQDAVATGDFAAARIPEADDDDGTELSAGQGIWQRGRRRWALRRGC